MTTAAPQQTMQRSVDSAGLAVESLTVRYGGVTAVRDLSMTVGQGEMCGLIGPNGSGKSTTLGALSRLVKRSEGRLVWQGVDYTRRRPTEVIRLGIARTFQTVRLVATLSVAENVMTGIDAGEIGLGLASSFFSSRRFARYERSARERADDMLERVGLAGFGGRDVGSLSYGQQRRVELARALVASPKLILLDEPTAGMSASERHEIAELLSSLRAMGTSLLLVEHNLRLISEVCDWVYVMNLGACIASGTPAEVRVNTDVITAYVGEKTS